VHESILSPPSSSSSHLSGIEEAVEGAEAVTTSRGSGMNRGFFCNTAVKRDFGSGGVVHAPTRAACQLRVKNEAARLVRLGK